jgi:hypothetical protein
LQHIADHQRPGIDKGITRFTLLNFELKQRVKGWPDGSLPTRCQISSSSYWRIAATRLSTFEMD